jgi:hypothetical protein
VVEISPQTFRFQNIYWLNSIAVAAAFEGMGMRTRDERVWHMKKNKHIHVEFSKSPVFL